MFVSSCSLATLKPREFEKKKQHNKPQPFPVFKGFSVYNGASFWEVKALLLYLLSAIINIQSKITHRSHTLGLATHPQIKARSRDSYRVAPGQELLSSVFTTQVMPR